MVTVVKGIYHDGIIELPEALHLPNGSRITVTLATNDDETPVIGPKALYGTLKDKVRESDDVEKLLSDIRTEWVSELVTNVTQPGSLLWQATRGTVISTEVRNERSGEISCTMRDVTHCH